MAEAPPIVAIKEANSHLQALHERNIQLEKQVSDLKGLVPLKEDLEQQLASQNKITTEKDSRITYLEGEVTRLSQKLQENDKKDLMIIQLARKVKILNEILKYKSALESITVCLEQVEEDFIVDIDNMLQVTNNDQEDVTEVIDVKKMNDIDLETSL